MRTTTLLSISLLLAACATPPEVRSPQRLATISVASMPPGQVLELNDRFVGMTPMKLTVPVTRWGSWDGGASVYVLRCSTVQGTESETKMFFPGEEPPSHVLFRLPYAMRDWQAGRPRVL